MGYYLSQNGDFVAICCCRFAVPSALLRNYCQRILFRSLYTQIRTLSETGNFADFFGMAMTTNLEQSDQELISGALSLDHFIITLGSLKDHLMIAGAGIQLGLSKQKFLAREITEQQISSKLEIFQQKKIQTNPIVSRMMNGRCQTKPQPVLLLPKPLSSQHSLSTQIGGMIEGEIRGKRGGPKL